MTRFLKALGLILLASLFLCLPQANARLHGSYLSVIVALSTLQGLSAQYNEGAALPPATNLNSVVSCPGNNSLVRDANGWQNTESGPTAGVYAFDTPDSNAYTQLQTMNCKVVVTLFGCATGVSSYGCAGTQSFPGVAATSSTCSAGVQPTYIPAQVTGFANFGAYVAAHVPNLYAISIWNEMNGTYNGGITNAQCQQWAMANLLVSVIPAIRTANPSIKIYCGAFVGASNMSTWFDNIETYGLALGYDIAYNCDGWDMHPYMNNNPGDNTQNGVSFTNALTTMQNFTVSGSTATYPMRKSLFFTEYAGTALSTSLSNGYEANTGAYLSWFQTTVMNANSNFPIAGMMYFLPTNYSTFTTGLLDPSTYAVTSGYGTPYVAWLTSNGYTP